jgi:energy-converting hydrogenase Eha subunit H
VAAVPHIVNAVLAVVVLKPVVQDLRAQHKVQVDLVALQETVIQVPEVSHTSVEIRRMKAAAAVVASLAAAAVVTTLAAAAVRAT